MVVNQGDYSDVLCCGFSRMQKKGIAFIDSKLEYTLLPMDISPWGLNGQLKR